MSGNFRRETGIFVPYRFVWSFDRDFPRSAVAAIFFFPPIGRLQVLCQFTTPPSTLPPSHPSLARLKRADPPAEAGQRARVRFTRARFFARVK